LNRYEWHYGLTLGSSGLQAELMFTKELGDEDAWEHRAVRFLMSLVPHRINRLRRCAYTGCNKWLYAAKRADQQFCERGNCRQNHYDTQPETRDKKKLYMRKRRAKEKKREEKSKKAIGYRGPVKRRVNRSGA